jgi:hypothetical protein
MTAILTPAASITTSRGASIARIVLLAAALLGVAADTALRNLDDGLGWTLWVIALAAAGAAIVTKSRGKLDAEHRAWLTAAVALAGLFSWRHAEELRLTSILGTLVAVTMFAMTACRRPAQSVLVARVRDIFSAGLYTIRDFALGAPMLVLRDAEVHDLPAARGESSWTALRALVITAPVVFVLAMLLSRADPVFASVFELPELDVGRVMSHVLLTGVFAWLSAGWLRGAVIGDARPRLPDDMPLRLGSAEVTTLLGAVIALFAIFVAIQLRWLFGGAGVVLATTGLTVAEYARRGFFELVTVTALVLPMILVTGALLHEEHVRRRHRRMSGLLLVLLLAIMASAALRMKLYVSHFGLTTDRLYASVMMLWLAVILAAMVFTILRERPLRFAAIATISWFATIFMLNVANPELIVVRVNLARTAGERGIDYNYLSRLSGDAVPEIVRALNSTPPSPAACKAARTLRLRWLRRQDVSWNLGAMQGRDAVFSGMSPSEVQRLCAAPG